MSDFTYVFFSGSCCAASRTEHSVFQWSWNIQAILMFASMCTHVCDANAPMFMVFKMTDGPFKAWLQWYNSVSKESEATSTLMCFDFKTMEKSLSLFKPRRGGTITKYTSRTLVICYLTTGGWGLCHFVFFREMVIRVWWIGEGYITTQSRSENDCWFQKSQFLLLSRSKHNPTFQTKTGPTY